jgi:hypothetical protein
VDRQQTPNPIEAYVVGILPGRPSLQPRLEALLDGAIEIARALLAVAPGSSVEINAAHEDRITIRLVLGDPGVVTGASLRAACREAYGRRWPAGDVAVAHDFEFVAGTDSGLRVELPGRQGRRTDAA